jgi:ATP phosphoribosyltransferase regulatory subunit
VHRDDNASPWITPAAVPLSPPLGLRDLLGADVAKRRATARRALGAFARYGYEPVITPAFEREDVLLRVSPGQERGDLVRFLDPDTAEVLALRADMTPQVARIVATRPDAPRPVRLCYEGSVLRRARGRASQQRQLAQAGVECVGWPSPDADLEVLTVTLEALRDNGIHDVTVELSHAAPLREALARVPADALADVADAVARKDPTAWRHPLRSHTDALATLAAVCAQVGDAAEVSRRAPEALAHLLDAATLRELAAFGDIARGLQSQGLAGRVLVDLGELRGRTYYTGMCFQVFARGAPAALASGGRYDGLLARFGVDLPATGAALDLDAVQRLGAVGDDDATPERVVVVGRGEARAALARSLRAQGAVAIERDPGDEDALARFAVATRAGRVVRAE